MASQTLKGILPTLPTQTPPPPTKETKELKEAGKELDKLKLLLACVKAAKCSLEVDIDKLMKEDPTLNEGAW